MQIVVVAVAVSLALFYAVWRIRKAVLAANDPCAGCEGCALKDAKRKNQPCEKKKQA